MSLLGLCLLAAPAAADDAAAFRLQRISHTSLRPGVTTTLTLHGPGMERATSLWTSVTADVSRLPGDATNAATFRVRIADHVPLQLAPLRAVADDAISNFRLLLIEELPTQHFARPADTRESALRFTPPMALSAAVQPTTRCWWRFSGHSGDRVSVDTYAARMGSLLDPVVILTDADGHRLAHSDDTPALGGDCRTSVVLPRDGEYFVMIRDARYRGGDAFQFHARLGNFPTAPAVWPLAAQQGRPTQLRLLSNASPSVTVALAASSLSEHVWLPIRHPGANTSSLYNLATSPLTEQLESEPNNTFSRAQQVMVPGAINGVFATPADTDWFVLRVHKDQPLHIRARHATLGVNARLSLRLYDEQQQLVAESAQTGSQQGALLYRAKKDALLRLSVQDLHRRHGEELVYRLEFCRMHPGFRLVVDQDHYRAPQTGVFRLKVRAVRAHYEGPIRLAVEGLPGATTRNDIIAAEKNETQLQIRLGEGPAAGEHRWFQVIGRQQTDAPSAASIAAHTEAWRSFIAIDYPPIDLRRRMVVSIGPPVQLKIGMGSLGAQFTAEQLQSAGVLREAESFDRGNVIIDREQYGKGIGIISDPGAQLNYAEFDLELPATDDYQVELRYAAARARPGKISVNGKTVKEAAIAAATGSWMPAGQRWFVEGIFAFQQGKNVLRLESEPLMSHIDKVLVIRSADATGGDDDDE